MLFFTQCFGAVLDLIHLRFQHYKAKRVFSAAGQLVCVVNPTHSLKVSYKYFFSSDIFSSSPPQLRFSAGNEMVLSQLGESAVNTLQLWQRLFALSCCMIPFGVKEKQPSAPSDHGKSLLPLPKVSSSLSPV